MLISNLSIFKCMYMETKRIKNVIIRDVMRILFKTARLYNLVIYENQNYFYPTILMNSQRSLISFDVCNDHKNVCHNNITVLRVYVYSPSI